MLKIGSHVSISDGFVKAAENSVEIGASSFQYFTRNPRGGQARELDMEEIDEMNKIVKENKLGPLFAHAAYTMNLASDKERVRSFARSILADDLERVRTIGNTYYLFHPGSHVGQGIDKGIGHITSALNDIIPDDNEVVIMLETMSGRGTEIGSKFSEMKQIIDGVEHKDKLGICLDTCHMYSAGYDIVKDLDGVLEEIDETVGIDRIKGIHINDSMTELGSNKDRHEVLGEGTIGLDPIVKLINHDAFKGMTYNLETPNELEGYQKEIELLRSKYKG